jgi:hypothetical protein
MNGIGWEEEIRMTSNITLTVKFNGTDQIKIRK